MSSKKTHIYEVLDWLQYGGDMLSIRHYREAAGMTQGQLAEKLEVDQTAISNWERGKNPPLKKYIRKMEDLFGVTEAELLRSD